MSDIRCQFYITFQSLMLKDCPDNLKNKKWERDFSPIDPILTTDYTLAYAKHMFKANEMLGPILASIQNLRFYMWLVRSAREAILRGDFYEWKVQTLHKVNRRL